MSFVRVFSFRARAVPLGLMCLVALAPVAKAQQDPVSVDWSALDAVSVGGSAAPIKLIAPPKRIVAVMPPAEKPAVPKPAPVAAMAPPPPPVIAAPTPPQAPAAPALPQQTAMVAVPRAVGVPPAASGPVTTIRYEPGASELPADAQAALDKVAAALAADPKARLQLVAYASGSAADPVAARRISLTRAVQMRTYLIAKGVQSVRMEVRALGDQNVGAGPADRVDLVIVAR
jgi:outer membrane protein OmpA-like peptidoglycan-associated protein